MRILLSMLVLLATASCVSAPPPPAPTQRVAEPPVPALPAPVPLASDWRDWPQTPGEWRYTSGNYGTGADFGVAPGRAFAIGCDKASRQIQFTSELAEAARTMTIRTTTQTRTLPIEVTGHPSTGGSAFLPATAPLLDAIAFSHGRFVVEQPGRAPLVLPAWAEVERVIEDCRG